jgi:hypothetical protein
MNAPQFGDLLKTPRGVYAHYGVYFGGGLVLEFSGDRSKDVATAKPRVSPWDRFSEGRPVYVVEHTTSSMKDIYARASHVHARQPRYNLIGFNCEHLARYVVSGKSMSRQSDNAGWGIFGSLLLALFFL